jgi:dihydrofolate reductase
MRKVIFQLMVTVDGLYEGPNREIDWHVVDEEFNEYANKLLQQVDTLVFGRVTYELMAAFWPTDQAKQDDPIIAGNMNRLKKVVFSKSLSKVDWQNTRLVKADPSQEIARMKQESGLDIAIFGSSDLALTLIEHHLIDEFRLFYNPIVLGKGKPIFQGIKTPLHLKLIETRAFKSGNVLITYRPEES